MSNYGIKISKAGYDAATALLEQLQLSSDYPALRIVAQGDLSLDTSGPPYHDAFAGDFVGYTFTIPHNLGYPPGFWVFGINNDTDNQFLRSPFAAHGEIGCSARSDSTNLYIDLYMAPWAITTNLWIGRYYIFANQV